MYTDFVAGVPRYGIRTSIGMRLTLSLREAERLAKTCFRGERVTQAGNFLFWSSFEDMIKDTSVGLELVGAFEALCMSDTQKRGGQFRLSLPFSYPIGWASAVCSLHAWMIRLNWPQALEEDNINANTRAFRVREQFYAELPAPLTEKLTIAGKREWLPYWNAWNITIFTMYPGEDIGPLRSDSSDGMLKNVVFWDWSAPGSCVITVDEIPNAPVPA